MKKKLLRFMQKWKEKHTTDTVHDYRIQKAAA